MCWTLITEAVGGLRIVLAYLPRAKNKLFTEYLPLPADEP